MAETAGSGGARVPQSFGEKLGFCFPAILVTLVLAVAIGVAITMIINNNTKAELTQKMDEMDKKLSKDIGEVRKANEALKVEVTALQTKTKELADENVKLAAGVETVAKSVKGVELTFGEFKKGQEVQDKRQDQDISDSKTVISKHDEKIVYIEKRLEILKTLETDVNMLKGVTGELKKEYEVLRGDLNVVRTKADVTEKDLSVLGERTKQFQLRVLRARAREAAEAARLMDVKTLLSRIEDVEGK